MTRLTRSPPTEHHAHKRTENIFFSLSLPPTQERFKLDMDEGPERTRLQLRPNRDFYDTYEVLAPAPFSSPTAAAAAAAGVAQAAESLSGQLSPPAVTAAAATTPEPSAAASAAGDEAAPAVAAEDGTGATGAVVAAGGHGVPPDEAVMVHIEATAASAGGAAAADGGAASPTRPAGSRPPVSPATNGNGVTGTGAADEGEGEQVAAIAALVKTMNASVGVGGKGGPRAKQPLTSVFDLDDTDCSALLELEELHLENAAPGGGEDVSMGGAERGRY